MRQTALIETNIGCLR